MIEIPEKFRLPFSEGSTWVEKWIQKHSNTLDASSFMQVKGKGHKEILALAKVLKSKGLPKNLALAFVHPTIETGVFLKPTAKALDVGELIGVYTGHYDLICDGDTPAGAYSYEVAEDIKIPAREKKHLVEPIEKKALKKPGDTYTIYTNALTMGNFTRFINHSSTSPNIEAVQCRFPCGRVEIVLFTQKKILPGEQLLSCYGGDYWLAMGFIPNDITPSTYMLNKAGKAVLSNPTTPLPEKVLKKLTSLRKGRPLFDEDLLKTKVGKCLVNTLPFLSSAHQKKLDAFEQLVKERALPLRYTLSEEGDFSSDKPLKKGAFIGCLSGAFHQEHRVGSSLVAVSGRSKLFLSHKEHRNFLNALPKKTDGNIAVEFFIDKESGEILPLAFAARGIKAGEPLSLTTIEPIPFA